MGMPCAFVCGCAGCCVGPTSSCDEQKKLLLSVAGANVELSDVTVRMARLSDDWQNLDLAIKAFDEMIEEQRSAIKASVEGEVRALCVVWCRHRVWCSTERTAKKW